MDGKDLKSEKNGSTKKSVQMEKVKFDVKNSKLDREGLRSKFERKVCSVYVGFDESHVRSYICRILNLSNRAEFGHIRN